MKIHFTGSFTMNETTNPATLYLTAEQCANRYNISLRQFQILTKRGDVPQPIKIGCSKRWSIRVLEEFESEQINRQSAFFQRTSQKCQKMKK
jgi:predicted DNA-binding transcriptional regulator AlpA